MCNTFHTFFAFLTFFTYLKFFTYFFPLNVFARFCTSKPVKSCKNILYKNGKKCVTHSTHSSHSSHSSHTLNSLHIFFPPSVFARFCTCKPVKTCKNVLHTNGKKCVTHSTHSSHSSHSSHTLNSLHIFFPPNVFARFCTSKPVKTCKNVLH